MSVILYGIPNCGTVKKARVWLDHAGVSYRFHNYKTDGVDAPRLQHWVATLGWEVLLNRAGTTFRKLPEAERVDLDADKAIALMIAHASMIKRPVLEGDGVLLVGFKPDAWAAALG